MRSICSLILVFLLTSVTSSINSAETQTLYSEPFSAGKGTFTIVDVYVPNEFSYIWTFTSPYGMVATAYKNNRAYESESWLVSPLINLSRCTNAYCTYMHAAKFQNGNVNRGITVWAAVNPTIDSIVSEEWIQLEVPSYPTKGSWTFYSTGQINLLDFAGKENVRIAIRYKSTSTAADTYEMKAFSVVGIIGDTFTVTALPENPEKGSVIGTGNYIEGSSVTLIATPNEGYNFSQWNDGNTSATREITVTSDTSFTAFFSEADTITINEAIAIASNYDMVSHLGYYFDGREVHYSLMLSNPSPNAYYVSGIVKNVSVDTVYKHATFNLTDENGNSVIAYRTKGLNAAAVLFEGQIQNEDKVLVYAKIQKVMRNIRYEYDAADDQYITEYELIDGYLTFQNNRYVNVEDIVYRISPEENVTVTNPSAFRNEVNIKSAIEIDLEEMPVTAIAEHAFKGSRMTKLSIPSSIDSIGESAFNGCNLLSSVISYAVVPPLAFESTFEGISNFICTLYVPEESISAYKVAEGWKKFLYLEPLEDTSPTALEQINNEQSQITNKFIKNNQLFILRDSHTYTLTGQKVK